MTQAARLGITIAAFRCMIHRLNRFLAIFVLISSTLSGCASDQKNTGTGALAGGGAGALIGGLAGGAKGAFIGGALGAAAGGGVGAYLDNQQKELKQVADAKRTQEGIVVNLKNDLLFQPGKSDLKPGAVQQLAQLGDILAKYKDDRIRVEGFTDSTGTISTNEALSRERAQAVEDVLLSHGVKPDQIVALGRGDSAPVASNDSLVGRSQNRRVELHIDVPQA